MLDYYQVSEVRRLRDAWIESRSAEDVGVRLLDAHFAYYEGRVEEALALQQREIERMPRGAWRRSELRAWSKISFQLRSIRDTYDAWPDKQELLRAIWQSKPHGSLINFEQILYRLEQLEDPDLFERLWCEREWAAIVDLCDGGSPEFVERSDLQDHIRSHLAIALLHQGSVDVCRRVLANQRDFDEEQMLLSVVAKEPQRALEQGRAVSGPVPLYPFNRYAISHGLPGVDEFLASEGWRELCSEKPVKLLPSLIQSPEYDLLLFQRQVQPASVDWLQDRLSKACIAFEEVRGSELRGD